LIHFYKRVKRSRMAARFEPPVISDNPTGWGPSTIPAQFKDMPYQPFSKSDRLGKVSDWTGATYQDRRYMTKYQSQYGAGGTQYSYYYEEDDSTFQLVDTAGKTKPMYGRGRGFRGRGGFRGRWNNFNNRNQQANTNTLQTLTKAQKIKERDRQRQVRKWQKQQAGRQNYHRSAPIKSREASVTVKSDWIVVEEMDFPRLAKLSLPTVAEPEDLLQAGSLEFYDKIYDRVNVKNEKPLQRIDRIFHTVTTTDDPVIRKLVKSEPKANVFVTDAILATLMCAGRSAYSWDIVVQKIGGKVFLDKRDNTEFDLLTVSETAAEPPQEEGTNLNSPRNLALEATFVNHNFSQQVLKAGDMAGERHKFDADNPFVDADEEGEVASVAYRYRRWNLGNDLNLICRCELDAVQQGSAGEIQFVNLKALNEWDSRSSGGVDWRQKLDTQRGAVLANELKNNACKLAKWTVQSILAGADNLKFGYVTRYNVKDSSRHIILGTQQFKPVEFGQQINLSMDNAWGIVRCVLDLVMAQKDGKYLIVKDPNKPMIRLYDIPDSTFESEEETDESEEDGDAIDTPLRA
jgi:translation initiation factor 3 subunit D